MWLEEDRLQQIQNSLVSFDEVGGYDQRDAEGFIKITSLRLKSNKLF